MDLIPLKNSIRAGNYLKASSLVEEMQRDDNYLKEAYQLMIQSEIGEKQQAEDACRSLFNSVKKLKNIEALLNVGSTFGQILTHNGQLEEAIETVTSILKKTEDYEFKTENEIYNLSHILNSYGNALFRQGKNFEALKQYKTSLAWRMKIKDEYAIAQSYGNIGNIFNESGSLVEAETHYAKSLDSFLAAGFEYETRITYNNLGVVYLDQGRFDRAESMFKQSLKIAEEFNDEVLKSVCLNNLGSVQRSKGNIKASLPLFMEALEIREKYNNQHQLAYSYYYLVLTYLDLKDRITAKDYLDRIFELHGANRSNKTIEIQYKILYCAYLKSSSRHVDIAKSGEILLKIVEDPDNYDTEITIQAYIYYCELLLTELQSARESKYNNQDEEDELIKEVELYTEKISDVAELSNLIRMRIQAIILRSYVALSKFEIEKAKELLNEAKDLSEEFDVRYFSIEPPSNLELSDKTVNIESKYSAGTLESKKSINKIIHSLPKLSIIFYLYDRSSATFMEMKNDLGLTPGNLGRHTEKLVDVEYIEKKKEFDGNKFVTTYRITATGLSEFRVYAENLTFQLQSVSSTE